VKFSTHKALASVEVFKGLGKTQRNSETAMPLSTFSEE